eukprot:TRINITY_DN3379_c0_g1_i5.p1 TRINITY_DN3379_c0_g1~~TRINITY_DN3379_c0_g1_i5.p1  ORF type:complete len:516 (+),score=129.67 TRINITY_DN3379_c0_g1_i5:63-1550(+)
MDGVAARCVVSIPGVVYLPFLYVLQGTAFAGAHVLFYNHGHTGLHVLGAVVVAAVVASPAAMYYALLRRVPECAEAVRDPRLQAPGDEDPAFPELRVKEGLGRGVYQACFGEDILVSVSEKWWVAEHYGVVFDRLRVDKAWFVGVEMARAVVLGLLSTWTPSSLPACDVRNFTLFAVLLTHLALLLWHRPYIAALTNVVNVVVAVAVAASMGAVVVGMALRHGPEDGAMQNGASLLWVATVCVQAKIVWDLGTRGYDIVSGRQRVVRRGWRGHPRTRHHAPVDFRELISVSRDGSSKGLSRQEPSALATSLLDSAKPGSIREYVPRSPKTACGFDSLFVHGYRSADSRGVRSPAGDSPSSAAANSPTKTFGDTGPECVPQSKVLKGPNRPSPLAEERPVSWSEQERKVPSPGGGPLSPVSPLRSFSPKGSYSRAKFVALAPLARAGSPTAPPKPNATPNPLSEAKAPASYVKPNLLTSRLDVPEMVQPSFMPSFN